MHTRLAHIRDRELQTRLLEAGILEARQIQEVLSRQYQQYQASHEELRGQLYQVSLKAHSLQIKQSIELSLLNSVELGAAGASEQDWPYWGRQALLLDATRTQHSDSMSWLPGDLLGLTLSPSMAYLHTADIGGQPQLIQTRQLLSPHAATPATESGPYDIFTDAEHELVCVVDRSPGDLWLVDTRNYEVRDIFTLRNTPGRQALLLEPDPRRSRILFVDQERPCLQVLDYAEGVLEEYRLGEQVPVGIALHGERLYLLLRHPQPQILCLHPDRLSEIFRVDLPEPLYISHHEAAANPMALSPDGAWLAVLTGPSQALHVQWLNTGTFALEAPESLVGRPQPSLMAFAKPNPLHRHRRRLAQLLLEEKLLQEQDLLRLFPDPSLDAEETVLEVIAPPAAREAGDDSVAGPAGVAAAEASPSAPRQSEAALIYLSPIERFTSLPDPHPAENVPLPESAAEDILHVLSGSFFQHTGIDLEAHPDALEKLREYARQYRVQLQDFDVIPVFIPELLPGTKLKTLLLRESILALVQLRHMPEYHPPDTPPTHCPECRSPLLGLWDCQTCGYELLTFERLAKRRLGSVLPTTWLPAGYFAVPDVQSGRLLLVNTHRYNYITWQIDFRYLPGARQPWDMLWLQDLHVLLTDRGAGRVLECTHSGRVIWELDTKARPELGLTRPVKSTMMQLGGERHYLIVDQGNHRVIQVDRRQRMVWHFGHSGLAGHGPQQLDSPNDVQFTHEESYLISDTGNDRVLEVKSDRVIRVFGTDLRLSRPAFAQRLLNGHTLIVDAGNYRLLEIDEENQIRREVTYFREGMDERFEMAQPLKMVRRENQNVVLIDANRVLEIDPLSKQIVWFSFLHELKLDIELPTRLRQTEIKMPTAPAYESYEARPDPEHMFTVRRTLQKIELFKGQSPMFFDALEEKLHFRRYRDGETIQRKGQPGHSFFVLQAGKAAVLGAQDEPEMVLEPGDSFGFMGLIFREPIRSTIQAIGDCGVYVLEKKDFDQLLPGHADIAQEVQRLAAERLVVARLRQTPKSQEAASRLKSLIAAHKERAQDRLSKISGPARPATEPAAHVGHRITYTEIERHVMAAAADEGLRCLELHITLRKHARMKAARVALLVSLLDRIGTIIRTEPAPEKIMEEELADEVILSLLTATAPRQVQEELTSVSDVEGVEVFSVEA